MLKELAIKYAPRNTEGVVFSHGFSFMGECTTPSKTLNKLKNLLNTGKEICCSKIEDVANCKTLGVVGCFVTGEVVIMANNDISTYIKEDGTRDIPDWKVFNIENSLVADYNDLVAKDEYCEIILKPTKIVGYWVRKEISKYDVDDVKEFETLVGTQNITYI